MNSTIGLLQAVKRKHGFTSDYQLHKHLAVSKQAISDYMAGRMTLGDSVALKVAAELELRPAAVLTAMHAERAATEDVRKVLEAAVRKLGGIAAGAVLAIGAASFGALPSPAQAGFNNSPNSPTSGAGVQAVRNTQCSTRRRRSSWGAALAALLGLALTACSVTPIDHVAGAPEGFPSLRVIEHQVDGGEVLAACYRYVSIPMKLLGAIPQGCAVVHFDRGECHIYLRSDYPDAAVREHELLHCLGLDHPGDSTIRDAWRGYVLDRTAAEVARLLARPN